MSKKLWGSVAVGLLGLFVGISNLFMAFGNGLHTRSLIIGLVCTILASAWLVWTFLTRRTVK
jgi:hypothetical protein